MTREQILLNLGDGGLALSNQLSLFGVSEKESYEVLYFVWSTAFDRDQIAGIHGLALEARWLAVHTATTYPDAVRSVVEVSIGQLMSPKDSAELIYKLTEAGIKADKAGRKLRNEFLRRQLAKHQTR